MFLDCHMFSIGGNKWFVTQAIIGHYAALR